MNKLKLIAYFISGLFVVMSFSQCTSWLDLEPENDLIEDEFWRKREDAEAMLAATYNSWRNTSLNNLIMGEIRGDMVRFNGSAFSDYNRIAQSDITTTNSRVNWGGYYEAINLANTLMYYAPFVLERDKTFSVAQKNAIDAEALFIRSMSYFYLVRLYKEVPLVLNPMISDTVNIFLPKSSEAEVLRQIVMDLKRAETIAYQDEFSDNPVYYKGRANVYSIWALLADVLLWQENYTECIAYCEKIITSNKFSLESQNNWFRLFYPGNSSSESIFEIQYSTAFKQSNPLFNNVVRLFSNNTEINMVATPNLSSLYEATDIRLLAPTGIIAQPGRKYASKDLIVSNRLPTENDANMIAYRYADILLMKAEALCELGDVQQVNDILTVISDRSSGLYEGVGDIDNLRNAVLMERAREFAGEGKRWFDILRYSKRNNFQRKQFIINMILSNAGVQQRPILESQVTDTMSYYLPIPEREITYNPKLVQNPFYDR
jgi:starch-binding outer membrane protein, SusD/RagB family